MINTNKKSAYIWIVAGIVFFIYSYILFSNIEINIIESLITFLSNINKEVIYLGAFIAIFIESIYLIGTFFPGSSLILLLAIASQFNGMATYFITILSIFLGWSLSTFVNIYIGKALLDKNEVPTKTNKIKENYFITWFPAFRANDEVSQASIGRPVTEIIQSSLKIKFVTSLIMMIAVIIIANTIEFATAVEETYTSVIFVGFVCLGVGIYKLIRD